MKFTPLVFCALLLLPTLSFAEDITLLDGTELKNVEVIRVDEDGIVVKSSDGVTKWPMNLVPKEVQLVHPYKTPTPAPTPTPAATPQETKDAAVTQPSPRAQSASGPSATNPATENGEFGAGKNPYGKLCGLAARGGIAFLVMFATLLTGSFFARRLITNWALHQKQKEFDSANAQQFHTAYTDFFAIWKLWAHYLDHGENELPDHGEYEIPHASRWELLTRTYIAEGAMEALFLKLTAARRLSPGEIELLGRFRQAFQTLGIAIKNNKPLAWKDPEHPDYLVFKRLASGAAVVISSEKLGTQAADMRADAFRQITSGRWERSWSSESSHPSQGK